MPALEDEDGDQQWEVEQVLDEGKIRGRIHYLVKWSGWPAEYNQWVHEDDIADDLIESFERSKAKTSGQSKAKGTKGKKSHKRPQEDHLDEIGPPSDDRPRKRRRP